MTEIEVKLKRVHSGRMRVWAEPMRDFDHQLERIDSLRESADYLVGWVDVHARGRQLGRGELHRAEHYAAGEDPDGEAMLDAARQDVPTTLFGVIPKAWIWLGLWVVARAGMIAPVNYAKCKAASLVSGGSPYAQTHGAFHFLFDYVPGWNRAFTPLVQFQPFVPVGVSGRVLPELFEMCQRSKLVPYLGVLKRHRPDEFLMTHSLDGFSIAMDFFVGGDARRSAVWELSQRMAEVVLKAGGRFYYAKDATLTASALERLHGSPALEQFRALKARHDPNNVLQTGLSRRMLGPPN